MTCRILRIFSQVALKFAALSLGTIFHHTFNTNALSGAERQSAPLSLKSQLTCSEHSVALSLTSTEVLSLL